MQRKYTKGVYSEARKDLIYPRAQAESKKVVACVKKEITVVKKQPALLENVLSINQAPVFKPAIKKDCIVVTKRRGKIKQHVKKDNAPYVTVVNRHEQARYPGIIQVKTQRFSPGEYKNKILRELRAGIIITNIFFWIPVFGFLFSLKVRRHYKLAKELYPEENFTAQNVLSAIALGLSIIFSIAYIAAVLFVLFVFALLLLLLFGFIH